MAQVLIVYGTTEGQTAKIAQHLADVGRRGGHRVDVVHAPELSGHADLRAYDAFLVGASVHETRYQRSVADFLDAHRGVLGERPSAFFSVSLAAAGDDPDDLAEVERLIAGFVADHGWAPAMTASFAGALKYTEYNWLKRMLMKQIVKSKGGDTDTSRDYEYTDWDAVTAFGERFFEGLS